MIPGMASGRKKSKRSIYDLSATPGHNNFKMINKNTLPSKFSIFLHFGNCISLKMQI